MLLKRKLSVDFNHALRKNRIGNTTDLSVWEHTVNSQTVIDNFYLCFFQSGLVTLFCSFLQIFCISPVNRYFYSMFSKFHCRCSTDPRTGTWNNLILLVFRRKDLCEAKHDVWCLKFWPKIMIWVGGGGGGVNRTDSKSYRPQIGLGNWGGGSYRHQIIQTPKSASPFYPPNCQVRFSFCTIWCVGVCTIYSTQILPWGWLVSYSKGSFQNVFYFG